MSPDQSLAAGRQRELAILAQQRELREELREIRRRDQVRKVIGCVSGVEPTIGDLLEEDPVAIRSALSVAARYLLRVALESLVEREPLAREPLAALLAELQPRRCPPGQPASTVGHPHSARTVPDAAKGGET